MGVDLMRLVLGLFWLSLAVGVFFRDYLGPNFEGRFNSPNADLVGLLALAIAGWNFSRWYLGRSRQVETEVVSRRPVEPRTERDRPDEYIPELDFTKPLPSSESEPTNGSSPAEGAVDNPK